MRDRAQAPTYYRLAETFRRRIRGGEWLPGMQLPTEVQCCRQHGLSRGTVTRALEILERDGLIERLQGRGTFVAQPRLNGGSFHILDFSDDMRRRGRVPGTRLLRRAVAPASPRVATALGLRRRERIIRIDRLRLADGTPMALETRFLAFKTCPSLLRDDLEQQSIHRLLIEKYRLPLTRAQFTMTAHVLRVGEARLLQVAPGTAGLRVERLTFTAGDRPVTLMTSLYRGDEYRLTAEIGPLPGSAS